MYIVDVFVPNASLNVNQTFSYYSEQFIKNFIRVKVSFHGSKTTGFVISCIEYDLDRYQKEKGYKLLPVLEIIDEDPLISSEQFDLASWLSRTTVSPFVSCLNVMLPKALRTSKHTSQSSKVTLIHKYDTKHKLTLRQQEIYGLLEEGMEYSKAKQLSPSIISRFLENGIIEKYLKEKEYKGPSMIHKTAFRILTDDQKNVYDSFISTDKTVSLLFGVTGSGKTEVYLHLARYYRNLGKDVLIMVPEIALTPQMIQRVSQRFDDVVFYHSSLSDQEKYEQYKRIKEHKSHIAVATRSGIFLPFENLGVIIIDEEHDTSYKQDSAPCYHLRNVAIRRAGTQKAKVLLASATPSLDSYARGLKGEYQLLNLPVRINQTFPQIKLIDMNQDKKNPIISKELKEAIDYTLSKKKQAIILLNRRGYSTLVKCSDCGVVMMCNDCDIPLTYHQDERILKCHKCGRNYSLPSACPSCGGKNLSYFGFGTKRVEEELKNLFPQAKITRMDHDSVSKKGSHEIILNSFAAHQTDILIGTQMIAKGLDYPDVTLVGIINGDSGLMHQDYNSAKLTFDLLMQASGRSGRAEEKGDVLIQVFNPDHYVIKAVQKQDYIYFYNIEMNYRSKTKYPPFSHLIEILFTSQYENNVIDSAESFFLKIKDFPAKIYPPVNLGKTGGRYCGRILLSVNSIVPILPILWEQIGNYLKERGRAAIKVDIDPLYLE